VRFSDQQYLRNLVHEGRHYHVLVLCWRSGQRSPIHNHAGSTCGMRVLQGAATETIFEFAPCQLVRPLRSQEIPEGKIIASQDADTHQVSNLQARGRDLITLHIYSPPLLRMDSYSMTEPHVGEWRPMVLSHTDGSGI
jgi:cysteine dioxygenase